MEIFCENELCKHHDITSSNHCYDTLGKNNKFVNECDCKNRFDKLWNNIQELKQTIEGLK